jgi:hypothetical protein
MGVNKESTVAQKLITVIGKDDLGHSWKFGQIIKGQEYSIEEEDFTDQLFERPSTKSTKGGTE